MDSLQVDHVQFTTVALCNKEDGRTTTTNYAQN